MCEQYQLTEEQIKKIKDQKFNQSLGDWMIENLGENAIDKHWADCNNISPFEIGSGSNFNVCFTCTTSDYHGIYQISPKKFTKGQRCNHCSHKVMHELDSIAEYGKRMFGDDFLDKYWSKDNTLNPYETPYYKKTKVLFVCQETDYHGTYESYPLRFFNGQRCGKCYNSKCHPKDSFAQWGIDNFDENFLENYWSESNTINPWEIKSTSEKTILIKYQDFDGDFETIPVNFIKLKRNSSEKSESILQEKTRIYLNDTLNFMTNHEYTTLLKCINPKTNHRLPYDNEVLVGDFKLIIEVHGEQHYKITGFTMAESKKYNITPEEVLAYQQWKDQYKKDYALSQGYYYLEIPYWTYNKQEEWKYLINNKIKEILHN